MDFLRQLVSQARGQFQRLSNAQRLSLACLAGTVVLSLAAMVAWSVRSDYTPLFHSSLTPDQRSIALQKLDELGVPYRMRAGLVEVPIASRDEVIYQLSSDENFEAVKDFFQWLFEENITDTRQRVDLKTIISLQRKLELMIGAFKPIRAAQVVISPGRENRLFQDRPQDKARASVVVDLASGIPELSDETVVAIANLVAGAVRLLEPEGVSIVDAKNSRHYPVAGKQELAYLASSKLKAKAQWESYYSDKITNGLLKAGFIKHPIVMVDVRLKDTVEEQRLDNVDPDSILKIEKLKEITTETSSQPEQPVAGATINTGAAVTGSSGSARDYKTQVTENDTAFSREQLNSIRPAGLPLTISAAVVIPADEVHGVEIDTDPAKWSQELQRPEVQERLAGFREIVMAALGSVASPTDVVVSFQPFAPYEPVVVEAGSFMLLWIWLQMHGGQIFLAAVALTAVLLIASLMRKAAPTVEVKPIEELLQTMREIEQLPKPKAGVEEELPSLEETQHTSAIKDQVREFISDNPNLIATLIREYVRVG